MEQNAKKISCGIIMPISAIDGLSEDHWQSVRRVIQGAFADSDYFVELVSESEGTEVIHREIIQNVYNMDMAICDVSGINANVMFELGLRMAFKKPVVIIKDDVTRYPFDIQPVNYLQYRRDLRIYETQEFQKQLLNAVKNTYDNSQKEGYKSLIDSFGFVTIAAPISVTEVSGEKFLIENITNMRNELRSLTRTVDERLNGYRENKRLRYNNPRAKAANEIENIRLSVKDYILDYFSSKSDPKQAYLETANNKFLSAALAAQYMIKEFIGTERTAPPNFQNIFSEEFGDLKDFFISLSGEN